MTSSGESTRKKNEGMMEIKQLVLQCALEKGDCTCESAPVGVPIFMEQLARRTRRQRRGRTVSGDGDWGTDYR